MMSCKGQGKTQLQNDADKSSTTKILKLPHLNDETPPWPAIVRSMTDRNGNLWFGTTKQGVFRCDYKDLMSGSINFTNYSIKDGLLSGSVYCMVEDKSGNIWFGTSSGVCFFNGHTFKSIPIPGTAAASIYPYLGIIADARKRPREITNILADKKGAVWMSTDSGVYRYDGKNLSVFLTKDCLTGSDMYCSPRMGAIYEDSKGNIWFSSTLCRYVYKLDEANATHPCITNHCSHSLSNKKELQAHEQEIAKCFVEFRPRGGDSLNDVQSMLEDKAGNTWFSTFKYGVFRYDGHTLTSFAGIKMLPDSYYVSMFEDHIGNIWFGTMGKISPGYEGIGVFKYDGQNMIHYSIKDGLADDRIMKIQEDKEGIIWFATQTKGVSAYSGKTFTGFAGKSNWFDDYITSIIADKTGTIWVATWDMGLSRFDGKKFISYTESYRPK